MLNYLWAAMMTVGIIWAAFHGTIPDVTEAVLDSAKEAVSLAVTMLGIMAFWSGIMEVGNGAGIIDALTGKMSPVMNFLFPKLDQSHPARKEIATNMAANMLGLSWAATPAGLKAMEELKKNSSLSPDTATKEMCTFLILNISSLQLIPMTMIAYRSQYGSVNPAAVTGPAFVATLISTLTAVIFCRLMDR